MTEHGIDKKTVFNGLVENALHFLERAIKDFESGELQQSLVNFVTGVELCLKARLLLDHWTLILNDPKKADPVKFMAGEFQSVGIKEAIQRLKKIVGLHISTAAEETFQAIWNHRKRMVHFYHPEYFSTGDSKAKEEIAGLELNGWGHLYILVAKYWHDEFIDYLSRFEDIDTDMLKYKEFLKGKHDALKDHIQKQIEAGIVYMHCQSCGYLACRLQEDIYPRFLGTCRICPSWMLCLEAKCEHCETVNYLEWDWEGTECINDDCREPFEIEYLLRLYGNERPEDGAYTNGFCEECYYAFPGHTVVEREGGEYYLCLSCFEIYYKMDECLRCGANLAGSHPDTGTFGCVDCGEALEEKRAEE